MEGRMINLKNIAKPFISYLVITIVAMILCIGTWELGNYYQWNWADFWSNLISNGASSAVIGIILYWIITRPDEKKSSDKRRNSALSMLEMEFKTNLERAHIYSSVLANSDAHTDLYPFRFTRGAWNALKESGFLPQFEDVYFVFDLLHVNENIVLANRSFSKLRRLQIADKEEAFQHMARKANKECKQIEELINPILSYLDEMDLPEIKKKNYEITFEKIDDYPIDDYDYEDVADEFIEEEEEG
jgi:hypothetical protein